MGLHYMSSRSSVIRRTTLVLLTLSLALHETVSYKEERVTVTPPGFRMKSLAQDVGTQQIVVEFVISGGANVVPVLYMPRVGSPESLLDVGTNPCSTSEEDKLCCLRSMHGVYDLDNEWAAKVNSSVMESCNSNSTPASYDNDAVFEDEMFPAALKGSTVLQGGSDEAIPGVVYSFEQVRSEDGVNNESVITMRMATTYIEPRSKVTDMDQGTYKYEFFVGVVFATLRQRSREIYTTVVQQQIEFTKSDFGFFAVGTEQDRSIIKQVETFIHQGINPPAVVDGTVDPNTGGELYQYMEVNVDYDPKYTQGSKSVKVMTDTLKFSKREAVPTEPEEWIWPCAPAANAFYPSQEDSWTRLLATECLPEEPQFCTETFQDGRFWVPFDVNASTSTEGFIHGINTGLSLFFTFEIIFYDSSVSSEFVETVYGTVNLNNFPVLEHCANALLDYADITETVVVTVALGTGAPADEGGETGMDLSTRGANGQVNKIVTSAASYGAAVISVVVDGLQFSSQYSSKFQIDNLMIFNFLGASNGGFQNVMDQIQAGTGLIIEKNGVDDHFTITPDFGGGLNCEEVSSVNYGISCLWRRAIVKDEIASTARDSIYYLSSATPTAESKKWVRKTFFPEDGDTSTKSDDFLKSHCPKAYATSDDAGNTVPAAYTPEDEGAYGCVFVDPGYRWISRGGNSINNPFMISDKTVVLAVVTIKPMDYENTDANGDRIPTRRLLSMNSDGSDMRMHPLSTFGMGPNRLRTRAPHLTSIGTGTAAATTVSAVEPIHHNHKQAPTPDEMQHELVREFAAMQLSNPPILSPKQMKSRLLKEYAHKRRNLFKMKTLGNTALSRKLLQSDSVQRESTMLDEFRNESASQLLVVENDFVCHECNIAYMYKFNEAKAWRMLSAEIDKPHEVPFNVFQNNIANVLLHQSHKMVRGAGTGKPISFSTKAVPTGRRMLEVTTHDGLSTTVKMDAIFKIDEGVGELFRHMFMCIMSASVISPINLTVAMIDKTAVTCDSPDGASAEVNKVQEVILEKCGSGTDLLSDDACNTLFQTFRLTAPSIAFDWYSQHGNMPEVCFSFTTTTRIVPNNDAEIIYEIRTRVAAATGARMDRVLVEVRESNVIASQLVLSRRLLAESRDMVVLVWIYAGGGDPDYLPHPWSDYSNDRPQQYIDLYSPRIKESLMDSLLTDVVMDDTAKTLSCPKPFPPQLHEYSVTVKVDFHLNGTGTPWADTMFLERAIKLEVSQLLDVPPEDIRILSVDHTPDATRPAVSVEIRVPTNEKMVEAASKLRSTAPELEKNLHALLETYEVLSPVKSVKIRTDSIKGTKDTVSVPANSSDVLVIILIVLGVFFFLFVLIMVWLKCRLSRKDDDTYVAASSNDTDPVAVDGPAGAQTKFTQSNPYRNVYQVPYRHN